MRELPPADVTVCNTVMLPIWLRRRRPDAGKVVSVMARMPKGQARLYGGVDLVLSLSTAVTAALQRENPALASRIVPFPFPIDFQLHADAACKRTLLDDAAAVQIGYVGRIHPEKGIDLLLEAAALLAERRLPRPWRLDLTGPIAIAAGGAGLEYRDRLLARHGPVLGNRLHFHEPEFDPVRLAGVYANTDVFCYPSVAEAGETFGVAVAEAMAARCAVVVSALDCFRDLVTDGATGLVFDHRGTTPASNLAERLSRLVQDSSLRSRLGLAAQEHVRCFDYEAVCTSVLGDLERIVSA